MKKRILTEEESGRIAEAIRNAELKTSGEIVPMIVGQSSSYDDASLLGGALGLVILFGIAFLNGDIVDVRLFILSACAAIFSGVVLGGKLMKRLFVSKERMTRRVLSRAFEAFMKHNLHLTKGHTGILILVSLFERKVVVLADAGINDKYKDWHEVVDLVLGSIKSDRLADGLIAGVTRCGEILAEHFPREVNDTNELSDAAIEELSDDGGAR